MDFFALQDDGFARSQKFFLAFGLAVFLAVIVLYFTITGCLKIVFASASLPSAIYGSPQNVLSLWPFLKLGSIIALVILFIAIRRTSFIKDGGGAYIAETIDGRLLESPANFKEIQLLNIVEEMAVAAGLPRPRLYIIPGERSINAITAGVDHEDAIIAITEGAVKHLDRDELQGVIAHEFGHILNGDYSLNLTMAGWLYGLMFFYILGRKFFYLAGRSIIPLKNNAEHFNFPIAPAFSAAAMGFFLMAGGWIGKSSAQLIQAAFSRQREYLADAFAVQFTRNPQGLASALKKIVWAPNHGLIKNSEALTMQTFFIVSPAKLDLGNFFKTHPPIESRIKALDPAWDGTLTDIDHDDFRLPKNFAKKYNYGLPASPATRNTPEYQHQEAAKIKATRAFPNILALGVLQAGNDGGVKAKDSLKAAHSLYDELPTPLKAAANDPEQVAALAVSVFMHSDVELKRKQRHIIEKQWDEKAAAKVIWFQNQMTDERRLPLLSLASPALKSLTLEDKATLSILTKNIVAADGKLDLFEIAACQILKKSLGVGILQAEGNGHKLSMADYADKVRQEVVTILSLLTSFSAQNENEALSVFASAMSGFNQWPAQQMLPHQKISARVLLNSLDFLAHTPTKIKNELLKAAASICLKKTPMSNRQYHLLRALAAALDVALPLGGRLEKD